MIDKVNIQADIFALAFLMPKEEFKREYIKHEGNKVLLAAHFQVGLDVIERRIKMLDLRQERDKWF